LIRTLARLPVMRHGAARMQTVALIVAAGRGQRFGSELPKQYHMLLGKPVLAHTLAAFAAHPRIDAVRAVIHPDDRPLYDAAARDVPKLLTPVAGGADRQGSVLNGLESLAGDSVRHVLIHDGARPLISAAVIDRSIAALTEAPGAIAALPVSDTLKRARGDAIGDTVDRTALWRAQTPQAFRFDCILQAHRQAAAGATDDAAVAERAGLTVRLVPGEEENLKITSADDLARAERLMLSRLGDVRVGQGFDVHRFAEGGDSVWLCGIKVPHARALEGHSDADVALHALTDAMLGAIGDGDIGQHFPPSDMRWKGAPSDRFLRHAADLVAARGGVIAHADVTIICERPKVGPHRAAMVARIAEILRVEAHRVSVKATTTEKLGFTGRGEGIAAQATATVRLPLG
jgi:2-C-methyl-D-erythritol 4-phosphate cytidylyltransferase/2-C-methyl-D-erythritol 2,4-cyclodiphosphate synthase